MSLDPLARPPNDSSARPFAAALLGYFLLIVLVITLLPFRFEWPISPRFTTHFTVFDVVTNVLLFFPLGFLYCVCVPGAERGLGLRLLVLGALFSGLIEALQTFSLGRVTSPWDVLTNALGAWLGALAFLLARQWLDSQTRANWFSLPVMGIVYLLLPLLWLNATMLDRNPQRLWLAVPLGLIMAVVLSAVYRNRYQRPSSLASEGFLAAAMTVFLVACLPAANADPGKVLLLTVLFGVALRVFLLLGPSPQDRRFEPKVLLVTWPMFAVYMIGQTTCPWGQSSGDFRWCVGFPDMPDNPGLAPILALLEQLGAFTLLGYLTAESFGRKERSFSGESMGVLIVCVWCAGFAEIARGFHPAHAASLIGGILSLVGSWYGGVSYRLQASIFRRPRIGARGTS